MGDYGKKYQMLFIQIKFRHRVRLKRSNDRGEFEINWTRSKNNIAENSSALASETNSNQYSLQLVTCKMTKTKYLRCHAFKF